MNKPLPRRKPQLTAPKLTLSDGFGSGSRMDQCLSGKIKGSEMCAPGSPQLKVSSSQPFEKHKLTHTFSSSTADSISSIGFGIGKATKVPVSEEKNSTKPSIFSDDEASDGVDSEKSKSVNKNVHLSKCDEVKQLMLVPLSKRVENSPVRNEDISESNSQTAKEICISEMGNKNTVNLDLVGEPKSEKNGPVVEENVSRSKAVNESKPSVPLLGMKLEETKTISFQPYKRDSVSPPERKCDLTGRWDDSEKDKIEEGRSVPLTLAELEERRREKELELNREFDRLLFSTKSLNIQQNEQRALMLTSELPKNPEKISNDSAFKYSKVHDSTKSTKNVTYPAATAQGNTWQLDKVSKSNKKETTGSSVDHCTQTHHLEAVVDLKEYNHEQNRTKPEKVAWEEKSKEPFRVDEKCKEFVKETSDIKEAQVVHKQESNSEMTMNKEVASEKKYSKETLFENKSSKELVNEKHSKKESNVDKRICREHNSKENSGKETNSEKTLLKEMSFEKCLNKESCTERKASKLLSEKKAIKEISCEKKVNKETNNVKKGGNDFTLEWRLSKDTGFDKKLSKEADMEQKLRKDVCKETHSEKRYNKDSSDKKIRNEAIDERKLRNLPVERKSNRDSSLDRRSIKDPSPEKKIKDTTPEKMQSLDILGRRETEETSLDKRSTKGCIEEKPVQNFPHENLCQDDTFEKKLDKDVCLEKKPSKNSPEKKAVKGNTPEKRTSKDSVSERKTNYDLSPEKSKEAIPIKTHSKDSIPDKKHSKVSTPEKKLNKEGTYEKKQMKDTYPDKKQSKDINLDKKLSKDSSREKKLNRDPSEKQSCQNTAENCLSKGNITDQRLNKEIMGEKRNSKEMFLNQRASKELGCDERFDKEPGKEKKLSKESLPEKTSSKDSTIGKKPRKESDFENKHKKEQCLLGRVDKEPSLEKVSIIEPIFQKRNIRESEKKPGSELDLDKVSIHEPGFEKRPSKELDCMKKCKERDLENSSIEKLMNRMPNSEKRIGRESYVKKRSRKEEKRLNRERYRERKYSQELCPSTGSVLRRDFVSEHMNSKELHPKQKDHIERCAEDSSEKSKLYRINKLYEGHNEILKVSKSNIISLESHKSKHTNRINLSNDMSYGVTVKDDKGVNRTDVMLPICTKEKTYHEEKSKLNHRNGDEKHICAVRPTIADVVKGRERRKSTDTDKYSGNEKGKQGDMYREETSTDSESSEELNEKVDLDTEQTQTFSVSESNFNQVSRCICFFPGLHIVASVEKRHVKRCSFI